MKFLVLILLPICLVACNPLGKVDDDDAPAKSTPRSQAKVATPTPAPKPGDWMDKKKIGGKLGVKEDRLGVKGDRLDEPTKK